MANLTISFPAGVMREMQLTYNWIGESTQKATRNYEYFDQITYDAIAALSPKAVKRKASVIYVFTQEQVDRILFLADFVISVTPYDFYFTLKRG